MKTYLKLLSIPALLGVILACNFTSTVITPAPAQPTEAPGDLTAAPTDIPVPAETEAPSTGPDISVSYLGTSFTIPSGLANGTQNYMVPQANDYSVWPAHTSFILQGYPLQGKAFEPQILIYPVKEFEQLSEDAGTVITNLQNVLSQSSVSADPLPFLPNEHAQQVFHAQEKFLSFKNGTGIRYITQYDQAPLPINNTELFYTFQGLTADGEFYVSVIMPVNLPYLPADNRIDTTTPADGVPFEWDMAKFPDYLIVITDRLKRTDNAFDPALEVLDNLVGSLLTVGQR